MPNTRLADWIGAHKNCSDNIDFHHVQKIAATFGVNFPGEGEELPPLWHWAFFHAPVGPAELGEDGHPARGEFLPPANKRNRMWAGGGVRFLKPLRIGMPALCQTSIENISEKQGRTGKLMFVTVVHEYYQKEELCIREVQDIVYREPTAPKRRTDFEVPSPRWRESVQASPVLLFRYSAVTFNGHRIHYDHPYATGEEGYDDLVIHGPLQATLMLQAFCSANPSRRPKNYKYRGLRPLTANSDFEVAGADTGPSSSRLWTFNADGPAHYADLEFEE